MARDNVPTREHADDAGPTPLGPDSQTWKDFGSYLFHLMLPQAFLLQSAHPVIDAGVSEHSTYKTDPWGRATRSTKMLWPVIYSRPEVAIQKGRELRDLHKRIRGVMKDGTHYHALDPEAYAWVHITGYDATIRMHELFGKSPTPEERTTMFEEWRAIGRMLGLREKDIPATEAEYWKVFNDTIEQRLIWGDVVRDMMDPGFYANYPKPPGSEMPDLLWKVTITLFGKFLRMNLLGTLPANFRERFGVEWTATDERIFQAYRRFVRFVHPRVPEGKRFIPLARRAIRDAKLHPEAYVFDPASAARGAAEA